jgi:solute carrier family 9B (sodium/hydrogen exchanger), member 1/2
VFRIITTFISVTYSGLTLKEKIFMCLAWLPKATIQAAVGSVALELARESNDSNLIRLGTIILNLAVVSIILTAPLGALLVSLTSKRLLLKND